MPKSIKTAQKILLLLIIFFCCQPLLAASSNGIKILKQIKFIGLSKSDEGTLRSNLDIQKFIGKPFAKKTKAEIKSRLWKMGIFSKISITEEPLPEGTIAKITLKEKWTLIPIPMFNTNGEKVKYGLFLLEQNLFGFQKTLYMGGMFSSDGLIAMLGYIDPSIFGSDLTFKATFSYKNDLFENTDPEENLYSRYEGDVFKISAGIGYKISSAVTLWYNTEYQKHSVDNDASTINAPQDAAALFQGIELEIRAAKFSEWKTIGLQLVAKSAYNFSQTDGISDGYLNWLRAKYNLELGSESLLKFTAAGSLSQKAPIMEERIGSKWGFKTLPQDKITCDDYFSVTSALETRIINLSWLNITILGFGEYGRYNSQQGGWESFYGVGGGFRFYLKQVAIPAMGYDIAWNMRNNEIFSSFAIGMQM